MFVFFFIRGIFKEFSSKNIFKSKGKLLGNIIKKMSSVESQREELSSRNDEVIISQDCPIIETDTQSSSFNRLGKFVSKIGQNQWLSEMDLFSTPMKLNFNGQDSYKTQFGGIMFLLVAATCVIMTIIFQFPQGIIFQKPITSYSLTGNLQTSPSLFEHTDQLFYAYLYNKVLQRQANSTQYAFIFKKLSVVDIKNGVNTILEVSTSCSRGVVCMKKSALNDEARIQSVSGLTETLQMEIANCGLMDSDPILGQCIMILSNYDMVIKWTGFTEETGKVVETTKTILPTLGIGQVVRVDANQYTTNNIFLGHIANVLSYQLTYYQPYESTEVSPLTNQDPSMNCFSFVTFTGNSCTFIGFTASGEVNYYSQNFDDITEPILFFVSLIQTLFFLVYFACIKNYNNNAFNLRLADSVVYHEDGHQKHYNFKSGAAVFLACLLHNNFVTVFLDFVLYKLCQTQVKRILPLKSQITMKMIDFGQKCLGEEMIFDQINKIYQQENLQPMKIIFEDPDQEDEELTEKEKENKKEEVESSDSDHNYFGNRVDEEAFQRMCRDHQFYSSKRKRHLYKLIKRNDKISKLALQTQTLFDQYRNQVKNQYCTREAELPVGFNEEESAVEMRKSGNQ